ncbi:MAG: response regulator, partial [Kofleriaceae bacterium]|nr:response regulator [Kofleriaceae bacterium]
PGDSSPTQVNKRPPRRSRRFDTEEHIALINFFREEADECLTRMSELLLETTDIKPSDEILHELMRHTHGLKGSAGTVELPAIAELTHEYENAVTKIYDDQWHWSTRLRDRLVEASDVIRSIVAEAENPDTESAHVGYWLSRLRNLDTADTAVGVSPDASGSLAFDSAPSSPTSPVQAPPLLVTGDSSDTYSERRRPDRRGMESPLLRVDPARIDQLMNTVGELVFDRTRIEKGVRKLESQLEHLQKALDTLGGERSDWAENRRDIDVDEVGTLLSELESALRESLPTIGGAIQSLKHDTSLLRRTEFALQDGLTAVRMQSVRGLFQRLSPQLRSIASQANKQVRLVTSGGETEFDKVVADQLIDPIIQLLRNAVAHAIESPDLRVARGKSPEGRIYVTARHEGNVVVLEVSDDGNGVDILALRDRFSASGKWTKEQAERASDAQVLAQIFEPGFSSSTNVDELSGRGVGLSLVRETVTRLGGEVLVSSIPDRGTTFTMRLPLTTAMVNAILFKVGGHVFAIPSVHVLTQSTLDCPLKPTAIDRDGESLPVVSLHETLDFELAPDKDECPAIFLEYLGKRLAISCDKIIGAREIVLQNLGQMLSGIPLYSGGTISPSGKVQLILDPAALVKIAYPADVHNDAEPPQNSGVAERVLVVDDSKAIREAMRRMLGRAGYDVITASDGLSAWHSLLEHRCDAVVTDLEMPGESGFEFLERLQADPRYQRLPKLVISSKANQQNCERAQSLGVSCIIPKPVDQAQLVDALRNARKAKS